MTVRRLTALALALACAATGCRAGTEEPPNPPSTPPGSATASAPPSAGFPSAVPPASPVRGAVGRITRITDGDTLVVDDERVRLIGIDAPESVAPGQRVQCFSREAAARLAGLVPPGTAVRLEPDPANGDRPDRYGRSLAYVHRESDGLFVNLVLVREGFAEAYPFGDTRLHRQALAAAEEQARAEGRGLWRTCRIASP